MFEGNTVLAIATVVFIISAGWTVLRGAALSYFSIAIALFAAAGLYALFPQLTASDNRRLILTTRGQIFILAISLCCLTASLLIRRPAPVRWYPSVVWRFLPLRAWLCLFFLICVADPAYSLARFGTIGIVHGNETMGRGGGVHSEVFTPLTFVAWSCGSMATSMLLLTMLFSRESTRGFLASHWFDLFLAAGCVCLNALSGNRFLLAVPTVSVLIGMSLFSRLPAWTTGCVAGMLVAFFVVAGNYRFGAVELEKMLDHESGIPVVDSVRAWSATYVEPIFPNLDNLIASNPRPMWGRLWLGSVAPAAVVTAVTGDEKISSGLYFLDNKLYAHHGFTFRTAYADLILDFGQILSLLAGLVVMILAVTLYNNALRSPRSFLWFVCTGIFVVYFPLLSPWSQAPNLIAMLPLALLEHDDGVVIE